jgi:hypothetical protein
MTMLLEQHIEELRAEMNHCHPDERRQIAAERNWRWRNWPLSWPSRTVPLTPCRPSEGGIHPQCCHHRPIAI